MASGGAGRPWFVGVDIGGTFTDVVLAAQDGDVRVGKVRTTPKDPVAGVVEGLAAVLEAAGVDGSAVGRVAHGTTLATNLVLEARGARIAFATTEGFGDLIRIPRGGGAIAERAETLVSYVQSRPFVDPAMTVEVPERMDARGEPVRELDEAGALRTARRLARLRPEAVAVCLLHSYANDRHEQRLADAWRGLRPEVPIYLSSEISPALREYGRATTTAIAAYVGPAMESYLERLGAGLATVGVRCPVHVMVSSGGVMGLAQVARRAVQTIESGPAAGVVSTQLLASLVGGRDLLSFDMGGTTAKCGLVRDGQAERSYELWVGGPASWSTRQGAALPVRIPVIDLAEVGAGGGSIAWVDDAGALRVGPRSAGADPGPACYGAGGTAPTVTDANVVLGYIDPDRFAGGALRLSTDLAHKAVDSVAEPLSMSTVEAAAAVYEMVTSSMAGAVRMMTVERGLDPRDFVLVSFGGSGPVHVLRIAESFGIGEVVVPAHAGVRSAVGLLGTDLSTDQVQTCLTGSGTNDPGALAATFEQLGRRAAAELGLAEVPAVVATGGEVAGVGCRRMADVRYRGQAHQLVVGVPDGPFDDRMVDRVAAAFFEQYKALYGMGEPGPFEIVHCRLRLERAVPKWTAHPRPVRRRAATTNRHRRAWFEEAGGLVSVPAFDWAALRPGDAFGGPAVVDGADATLVVTPRFEAAVDGWGNVVLSAGGAPGGRGGR